MIENDKYFASVNTVQLAKHKKSTIYFNYFLVMYLFIYLLFPRTCLRDRLGENNSPKEIYHF